MASPATRSQSSGRTQGNNYLDYEMPPESICLMLRSRRYRISCTRSCLCVCHQKKFFRLSYPFANVLGNLFGGYSGLPLITPACNASRCLRGSAAIDINYYFPISYFERILRASVAISSNGISQSISMTRVRDWYCPLWQYTRDSEKVGIQALFDTGRASPYDVNVFGQSALHVNVIRSARRFSTTNIAGESVSGTLKLDLCQFLIQQGADPYLQDKNGR